MPQMAPMYWFILFLYFVILFMFYVAAVYYFHVPAPNRGRVAGGVVASHNFNWSW